MASVERDPDHNRRYVIVLTPEEQRLLGPDLADHLEVWLGLRITNRQALLRAAK